MSLTVSHIIKHVDAKDPKQWTGPEIATTLAIICGLVVLTIGLLRLGWLVEFIPAPAVSGFMTGSAINIAAGQVPGLMGITGFEYVVLEISYLACFILTTCLSIKKAPAQLPTK
jgi:sodium-independent sulfate anion transporter 11